MMVLQVDSFGTSNTNSKQQLHQPKCQHEQQQGYTETIAEEGDEVAALDEDDTQQLLGRSHEDADDDGGLTEEKK